jgi:hypothetical protein
MTDPQDRLDRETPEADAAEQAMLADPSGDDDEVPPVPPRSAEVPEWDALEQSQPVHLEDEFR